MEPKKTVSTILKENSSNNPLKIINLQDKVGEGI